MSSKYCKSGDLLVGDLGGTDPLRQQFVDLAADEMDAMIGFVYVLPLDLESLQAHVQLILKNLASKLASGRLLMAQAVGAEETSVHAYGKSLVDEAMRDLYAIRNGQIDLGAIKVSTTGTNNAPVIIEGDLVSAVDAFYDWQAHPPLYPPLSPNIWRPGPNG